MVEKIVEIEEMYSNICSCCEELEKLIDEPETLGERAGLRYKLALFTTRKETLKTCLSILNR